ncbi:T9SS type A sorting domain-containing protein [Flavisolibacter sp. BT320]|nr:T9SS type A sorting domain-containing protein [Flavisolibacter longurius]
MRNFAGALSCALSRLLMTSCMLLAFSLVSSAQYCIPTVQSTGLYLSYLTFDYGAQIQDGKPYSTGNNGYSQTLGSSSGIIKPYWGGSIWYGIANNAGASKNYRIKVFVDWNNDGDFDDHLEDNASNAGTVGANSNLGTGVSIIPPLFTSGTVRVRIAMAEGTVYPTACGSFTGEAEDYLLTIATNQAPVLNTSLSPKINPVLASHTDPEGFTINQFLSSVELTEALASDANDNGGNRVPRGLAIYGQSAPNGTWQYRAGDGAWQAFGPVSAGNALLLIGDGTNNRFQPGVRIRFVPTAAGTVSFTYRLWDGTSAENASYAAIGTTGGNSAFSAASSTVSTEAVSAFTGALPLFVSTADRAIFRTTLNSTTSQLTDPVNAFQIHDDYTSNDITVHPTGSHVYWIAGAYADRIAVAKADGSGVQTVVNGLNYGTGIAAGPDRLFYTDWTPGVFRVGMDGSSPVALIGGAGQLDPDDIGDIGDIEYANNRIFFIYYTNDLSAYRILSADTDGTQTKDEYTTTEYIKGLSVTATHLYWTEFSSSDVPNTYSVKKKNLSTGTVETLTTVVTGRNFNDLIVDEANHAVYVVVSDGNSSGTSEVRKLPTTGGTLATVLSLRGNVTSLGLGSAGSSLPVRLVKLEASLLHDRRGQLCWVTGSEEQSQHFVVEKSSDGRNFQPVATVASKNAASGASYCWTDGELMPGDTYYRLWEVSTTGQRKDLGIRRLVVKATGRLQLYPLPYNGNSVTLNTGYKVFKNIPYHLVDAAGRVLLSGSISQQVQTLPLGKLPAGFYLLRLGDGQQVPLTVN